MRAQLRQRNTLTAELFEQRGYGAMQFGDLHPHRAILALDIADTLERKTLMTGEVIADARVRPSTQLEGPYVEVMLNSRGAKLFEQLTSASVGRRSGIQGSTHPKPFLTWIEALQAWDPLRIGLCSRS